MSVSIKFSITLLTLGYVVAQYDSDDIQPRAEPISISEHPYYVGIENVQDCGAALISERFVITTAICAIPLEEGSYVYVGGTTIRSSEDVLIQHVIINQDYRVTFYEGGSSDIALLMLDSNVTFSDSVQAIDLPRDEPNPEDTDGYTLVFRTGTEETQSLKEETDMYIYPASDCYKRSEYKTRDLNDEETEDINSAEICAVQTMGSGEEVCESNEGSLLIKENILYGVGAFRYDDCQESGNFLVNIQTYIPWIDETMERVESTPPSEFLVFE